MATRESVTLANGQVLTGSAAQNYGKPVSSPLSMAVPKYGDDVKDNSGKVVGQAKFNPNTGAPLVNPNQSTTTLSNANKIKQVAGNVGTLDTLSAKGSTTDANGNPVDPTGAFIPEPTVEADTSDEDSQISSYLDSIKQSTDANTAFQIGNIQQQFAQRKQQQAEVNRRNERATQTALLMGGVTGQGSSAQYAPVSSQGIVQAQESYGVQQLASLDAEENNLIAQAKQAQQEQNYKLMEKKLELVQDKRKEKLDLAAKLNDQIAEQNKKAQEEFIQSQKDEAIGELYSGGVTDVPTILKKLREQGITASASDVAKTLDSTGVGDISKIAAEASANGAPLSVLAKIGQAKTPMDALMAAGEYTRDPLDVAYKKAQLAKIYDDLGSGGISGQDASGMLAYAQQYASTGQIPTGLPKGTFGVVSQIAKELPKSPGTLVDKNTGIKPAGLSATQTDGIVALKDLTQKLKDLENMPKVGGPNTVVAYNGLRNEIIDLLARARTGAAISSSEEALYKKKIPGINSLTNAAKINSLTNSLTGKLNTSLDTNGVSIYGYSRVQIPGLGEKTVGDTIESNGVLGRVNPDGTITILNQ